MLNSGMKVLLGVFECALSVAMIIFIHQTTPMIDGSFTGMLIIGCIINIILVGLGFITAGTIE